MSSDGFDLTGPNILNDDLKIGKDKSRPDHEVRQTEGLTMYIMKKRCPTTIIISKIMHGKATQETVKCLFCVNLEGRTRTVQH